MIAVLCLSILAAVAFALGGRDKTRSRLGTDELRRVRRISEVVHREDILPFE